KEDAMATLSASERSALAPILEAKPEIKSPQQLLAERPFIKTWTVNDLVPIVEQGLKGGRNLNRGHELFGAVACAACHRFNREGGAVGPDLTTVSLRFSVHDV